MNYFTFLFAESTKTTFEFPSLKLRCVLCMFNDSGDPGSLRFQPGLESPCCSPPLCSVGVCGKAPAR